MLTQYGEKSCTKLVVPVQRIDGPFERLSFDGGGHGPFFGDESCVGSQFAKPFDDHLFGLLVDI